MTYRLRVITSLILFAMHIATACAADVAERAGLSGGVACFINPASESEALELARHGRFLVFVAQTDNSKVVAFRQQAEAAGLLGRTLYVEHVSDAALPFADHVVDLVVAPEAANGAEVLRVLSPARGKAFLGERVLTKPSLMDSDDWTHRLHGPDNNPVSQDSAFRGPAMLQYLAMPMQTSFQGTMLVGNGRRIELSDWVTKKPDRNNVAGILRARCLYNGQPLWERQLPKNIEPDMPICALDGDRVYLAADDACRVMVIDAETGEDVASIKLSDHDELRVN